MKANLHPTAKTSWQGSVGPRLDRMPITGFHRRLAFIIGAGLLVDSIDVYLTAGVSGALLKQGVASLAQIASLAFVTALGLGLGGLVFGGVADRIGRRRTLQTTVLVVVVGSFGAALSPSFQLLLAWRFLTALGLGGEPVLGYSMLGEFMPPSKRGGWMARLGLLANMGIPLSLLIGYFVLPHPAGWRWMLAIPGVAASFVFLLRLRLPESPRWLATQGRRSEAEAVLSALETTAVLALPPFSVLRDAAPTLADRSAHPRLFARGNWARLIVGASVNIAIMSAIYGFVSWLPTFFASSGKSITSSLLFAGIMSMGAPTGTLIGMLITDRVERKWGLVVTSILTALLGVLYAFASTSSAIILVGFLVVTTIYVVGTFGIVGYVPELFPTALRMRAVGLCATAGRIVIIGLPFVIIPLFSALGQPGIIALVGSILVAQAAIVAFLGVPTKGRSLEAV